MRANEKAKNYAEKLIHLLAKKTEFDISKYDINELVDGMLVELEHGSKNEKTDITSDDPIQTLKIVLVHMDEIPDYYTRLRKMEDEADSVKTDNDNESEDDEDEDEKKEKANVIENIANRFKELCGIMENKEKKQLINITYQENNRRSLLKEEINRDDFEIVKFSNDGIGEKNTEDDIDLYKMKRKSK